MKPFGRLLDFDSALKLALGAASPVTRMETLPLDDALGRVLAGDVTARLSIPPFDRAAMDGYAVIARDTFGASRSQPKTLFVTGVIFAGDAPNVTVSAAQAVQIATGAQLPQGADAVVMVEESTLSKNDVSILKAVYPGANIARTGEDIKSGDNLLPDGAVLNAGKIGMLASQGLLQVSVYVKPIVAILPTGEEIAPSGADLQPGQIWDINSHTVAGVVAQSGGIPIRLPIARDEPDALRASIQKALEADMVIISGGSSVGERDFMSTILSELGKMLFHGIQIKPGKPTLLAVVGGKPVLGLPGYPTSCLLNAYLLAGPMVRMAARLPLERSVKLVLPLAEAVPGSVGRRQFLPVRVLSRQASPLFKESGAITATALADGYIDIPANVDILPKGENVTVTLF